MAQGQLALRDQRWPGGPLYSHAGTRCRWSSPAYAWVRSLADWRAPFHRRTEILSVQPASRHLPQTTGRCDQGPIGLRIGASATQGGAGPRSLCGAIMDRPAPIRPDVHDGLRLSPVPAPHGGRAEKKESPAHHHSPVCQQYDRPSLIASCAHPPSNARNIFCQSSASHRHPASRSRAMCLHKTQRSNQPSFTDSSTSPSNGSDRYPAAGERTRAR